MMENTTKLLNEIAELKEKLHKHGKAIARIEHWHSATSIISISAAKTQKENAQAREVEKGILEMVLRIFEGEGVR